MSSGGSSVTLQEGEYTQMQNGGGPPTRPGPPPPGLIGSLLQNFQSQGNQGGGAPVSPTQVNQARTAAIGSPNGPVVSSNPPTGNERQQTQQNSGPPQQIVDDAPFATTTRTVRAAHHKSLSGLRSARSASKIIRQLV